MRGDSETLLTQNTGFLTFFPVTFSALSEEHKIDWFGTVRGRFGYTMGPVLVYATGGLAYGEVNPTVTSPGKRISFWAAP